MKKLFEKTNKNKKNNQEKSTTLTKSLEFIKRSTPVIEKAIMATNKQYNNNNVDLDTVIKKIQSQVLLVSIYKKIEQQYKLDLENITKQFKNDPSSLKDVTDILDLNIYIYSICTRSVNALINNTKYYSNNIFQKEVDQVIIRDLVDEQIKQSCMWITPDYLKIFKQSEDNKIEIEHKDNFLFLSKNNNINLNYITIIEPIDINNLNNEPLLTTTSKKQLTDLEKFSPLTQELIIDAFPLIEKKIKELYQDQYNRVDINKTLIDTNINLLDDIVFRVKKYVTTNTISKQIKAQYNEDYKTKLEELKKLHKNDIKIFTKQNAELLNSYRSNICFRLIKQLIETTINGRTENISQSGINGIIPETCTAIIQNASLYFSFDDELKLVTENNGKNKKLQHNPL